MSATDLSLHEAAQDGDAAAVAALLDAGAPVAATDCFRDTPLHRASRAGHANVATALLAAAAPVNGVGLLGNAPLHDAAGRGFPDVVAALLAAAAPVGAFNDRSDTPLHLAASSGHAPVVVALLAAGAPVGAANSRRDTPLHWAAQGGHAGVVAALLAAGAPVGAANDDGDTPLHWAAEASHADVAAALLAAGSPVAAANGQGDTPLHSAAVASDVEVVGALLAAGAWAGAANTDRDTPLHKAASGGHAAAMVALLTAGAPVGAAGKYGDTPLHCAATAGHTEAMAVLLAAGAPVHAVNDHRDTVLHKAASVGNAKAVAALLAAGATSSYVNEIHQTPLGMVSSHIDLGLVEPAAMESTYRLLLRWGATRQDISLPSASAPMAHRLWRAQNPFALTAREREVAKEAWRKAAAEAVAKANGAGQPTQSAAGALADHICMADGAAGSRRGGATAPSSCSEAGPDVTPGSTAGRPFVSGAVPLAVGNGAAADDVDVAHGGGRQPARAPAAGAPGLARPASPSPVSPPAPAACPCAPLFEGGAATEGVGAPLGRAGIATAPFGRDFFAGVLGWSYDTLTTKLVAFVSAGYSPASVQLLSVSVRHRIESSFLNGAAVVGIEDAAVAETVSLMLDSVWQDRPGAVAAVQLFIREAKAAGQADRVAAASLRRAPPQG